VRERTRHEIHVRDERVLTNLSRGAFCTTKFPGFSWSGTRGKDKIWQKFVTVDLTMGGSERGMDLTPYLKISSMSLSLALYLSLSSMEPVEEGEEDLERDGIDEGEVMADLIEMTEGLTNREG
jgi:hypothetical protein